MRAIVQTGLLAAFLSAVPAVAQTIAGGTEPPAERPTPPAAAFGHRLAVRGGPIAATGRYGRAPFEAGAVHRSPAALEAALATGSGATTGFFGEVEQIYHLAAPLPGIGLDLGAAVSGGYVGVHRTATPGSDPGVEQVGDVLVDVRVGPGISINPAPSLFVDASLKLGYGLSGGSRFSHDGVRLGGSSVTVIDSSRPTSGLARSFGIGVRYRFVQAGWETHGIAGGQARTYQLIDHTTGALDRFEYTVDAESSTARLYLGVHLPAHLLRKARHCRTRDWTGAE